MSDTTLEQQAARIAANKKIAEAFFAALNRADSAAIAALYAEDGFVWTAGTLPFSGKHSREEIVAGMDAILAPFPEGLRFTIKNLTAEGDRVAIEAESYGRHASGKIYNNQYHFLMVIRDGKVAEFKEYLDTMHAKEVLVDSAVPRREG